MISTKAKAKTTTMTAAETTTDEILELGKKALGYEWTRKSDESLETMFRDFFGAPPVIIAELWNIIFPWTDHECKPLYLLWALVFLKVYGTESVNCRIVGCKDPKIYRKWVWHVLEVTGTTAFQQVITLQNRFHQWDQKSVCLMSVDCTHCPINEPWPFDPKWYSEKSNGPGLTYEVAVCIQTGWIVWVNGPFPAGTGDATIFKANLKHELADEEGVEVDKGYSGDHSMKNNLVNKSRSERSQKNKVRARHEIVNSRIKIFSVLQCYFRHLKPRDAMIRKHEHCFKTCAVVAQLKFKAGETIFNPTYDVDYSN
jgi:hypothetical protein